MPREVRHAQNRSLFREVNERIAALTDRTEAGLPLFTCECSRIGCAEKIEVPPEVFARVRNGFGGFLLMPGHEESREEILERGQTFVIVREG